MLLFTENASREEHDVDQTVVVSANTVLSNNRLNTVRFNFTREDVAFANQVKAINPQIGAVAPINLAAGVVDSFHMIKNAIEATHAFRFTALVSARYCWAMTWWINGRNIST